MMSQENVTCGVGVIVCDAEGRFLLMRRLSHHGKGQFSIPGGTLEPGESALQCAQRELVEETGIIAQTLQFIGVTNNLKTHSTEGIHSISLIYYCNDYSGNARIIERDKHEDLSWYHPEHLPHPLFEPSQLGLQLLQQYHQGKCPGVIEPNV